MKASISINGSFNQGISNDFAEYRLPLVHRYFVPMSERLTPRAERLLEAIGTG